MGSENTYLFSAGSPLVITGIHKLCIINQNGCKEEIPYMALETPCHAIDVCASKMLLSFIHIYFIWVILCVSYIYF